MKKFLAVIILLGSVSFLSASSSDKNRNQVMSLGDGYVDLQSGTSAALTIAISSSNTGTTTGRFTMYASSLTLEQLNTGGGATTNYFNVLLSTSDSIFDIINRINEITNFTATLPAGCYGLQYATGSASARVDSEGTTDGIQYDETGKSVSFSTGSANAVTIYFNNTLYTTIKKSPVKYTEYGIQSIETSLAEGTTMSIYAGDVSSNTTTLLVIPHIDINQREYPIGLPIQIPDQKYWEFLVKTGTWTVCSGDAILRNQILYFKFKR